MRIRIFVFGLLLFICSCRGEGGFTVDSYTDLPAAVKTAGSGCIFGAGQKELDKEAFLFSSCDNDSSAYVTIGGKLNTFKQVHGHFDTVSTDFVYEYANSDYKLTVDMKHNGNTEEESNYHGQMILENNAGKKITVKMVGTCGSD